MIAGHQHLYALKGADGLLCFRWWASERVGIFLFASAKDAATWAKKVNKLATKYGEPSWAIEVQPVSISEVAEGLQLTINPSDEYADVRRMMSRMTWKN